MAKREIEISDNVQTLPGVPAYNSVQYSSLGNVTTPNIKFSDIHSFMIENKPGEISVKKHLAFGLTELPTELSPISKPGMYKTLDFVRKPHGCCEGYTFNATLDTCVECGIGFYTTSCSLPCPYPTYGRDCQNICNCTKYLCDYVQGCLKEFENGTAVISSKIAQKKQEVSANTAMTSALIGLVSLSVLVLIAYAIQKRYGGRDKPMLDIMEMGQRGNPDKCNNL